MPISPIRLYKLYTYTQYILIHAITLYGKLAYTWYMLILDIPLYVVDVHMTTGLYSSIVYRYTIVIWLYKKMQTRNQHSVRCLHNRINGATVRRVLQTAG